MAQKVGPRLAQREILLRQVPGLILGTDAAPHTRIIYVAHDHLNRDRGALHTANMATDVIVLVESARMTTGRNWHKERLFFLVSSARHLATELENSGFTVRYIQAPTTIDGLAAARVEFGNLPIVCAGPSSHRQFAQLAEFGVEFVDNDFFLTPRALFAQWASPQKSFVMENFYRAQRVRLGILVENGKPVGERWNFDADNRLPPPKNYTWPPYLEHARDAVDRYVAAQFDHQLTTTWATTRAGALAQLDYFLEHHLAGFGPYEDAIAADNWALHHSLLSPYLNNGLLHASEVVGAAVKAGITPAIRLATKRQTRRFMNGWKDLSVTGRLRIAIPHRPL